MNNLKNSVIAHLALLCLWLVGCSNAQQPDLTGKWLNADKDWGLEFREGQVSEWEGAEIQTKSSFTLSKSDGVWTLVVNSEEDGVVSFTVELLGEDSIRLTHVKLNEQVELKRQ